MVQCLSRTGCTSLSKPNPLAGPYHGSISAGALPLASVKRTGGELFCSSWHPTHDSVSPGMAVIHERIRASALPSSSRGWTAIGVLAGTRKKAEPSASTGTVPMMRRISQGPSMPITP